MTNGAHTTTITSGATGTHTFKLPSAQGSNGSVLSNDGSGNLSWNYVPRLYYALQGILADYDTIRTDMNEPGACTILPIKDLVSGNPNQLYQSALKEYVFPGTTSFRNNNEMTCPSTGWYQISCSLFHPFYKLQGTITTQAGMFNFRVGIQFTNPSSNQIEHSYIDTNQQVENYTYTSGSGAPDVCSYNGTLFLVTGNKFNFMYDGQNQNNQDILVRVTIMKLTDGTVGTKDVLT
jgi:hypothetical protein